MIDYGKRSVLDVRVDAVDLECALDRIMFHARRRRPFSVSALAVHGVVEAHRSPELRDAINEFDLVLPDGEPVRRAINSFYGLDLPFKVAGPTLVDRLLELCAKEDLSVYFYGSTGETLSRLQAEVECRFGGTLMISTEPSRFQPISRDELRGLTDKINASGAALCFVGLGCPRQERFVAAAASQLAMPALAVGAAFDYLAGTIQRAPDKMQRVGLEWAYRLMQDPRRLASRYFVTNSVFVGELALAMTRSRMRIPAPQPRTAGEMRESVDA
jgi:exopolysaccharide biosynthesis WecB/TagA/CpsF family protein